MVAEQDGEGSFWTEAVLRINAVKSRISQRRWVEFSKSWKFILFAYFELLYISVLVVSGQCLIIRVASLNE